MNIYKNLLFLHGYLLDRDLDEDGYRSGYGNRPANERALRPRWQHGPARSAPARRATTPQAGPASPCFGACG